MTSSSVPANAAPSLLDSMTEEVTLGVYPIKRFQYLKAKELLNWALKSLPKAEAIEDEADVAKSTVSKWKSRIRQRKDEKERVISSEGILKKFSRMFTRRPARAPSVEEEDEQDMVAEELLGGDRSASALNPTRASSDGGRSYQSLDPRGGGGGGGAGISTTPIPALVSNELGDQINEKLANDDVAAAQTKKPINNQTNSRVTPFEIEFRKEVERVLAVCKSEIAHSEHVLETAETVLNNVEEHQTNAKHVDQRRKLEGSLRDELKHVYHALADLSNYATANETIALRILGSPPVVFSKYGPRIRYVLQQMLKREFALVRDVIFGHQNRVERSFAGAFTGGQITLAHFELLSFANTRQEGVDFISVLFGFTCSAALTMIGWLTYSPYRVSLLDRAHLLAPIRACCMIIAFMWAMLLCLYVFKTARINFVVLLELSPASRKFLKVPYLVSRLSILTLLVCLDVMMALFFLEYQAPFLACCTVSLLYPLFVAVVGYFPMLRSLFRDRSRLALNLIGLAPHAFVTTLTADILISMNRTMGDIARFSCFVLHPNEWGMMEPAPDVTAAIGQEIKHGSEFSCDASFFLNTTVIALLAYPLWLRLIQNLRQTAVTGSRWPFFYNALKYALAHQVVIVSTIRGRSVINNKGDSYHTMFTLLFFANSLVSASWDIGMDFGLGRLQYSGLRDRLMFSRKWVYYSAIVLDLVLRFVWTYTLVAGRDAYTTSVMMAELCRRTFWCMVRVENEHLNNTLGYRSVDFVPLYFDMDEDVSGGGNANEDEEANAGKTSKIPNTEFGEVFRMVVFFFIFAVGSVWTVRFLLETGAEGVVS